VWNKDASRLAFRLLVMWVSVMLATALLGIEVCHELPKNVADRAKIEMAA
jgi:hypothetical protein